MKAFQFCFQEENKEFLDQKQFLPIPLEIFSKGIF